MSVAIDTPIIIFSFARPDYLERLCRSIKAQERVVIAERDIYLLQDGAVSPRTGVRYTDDARTEQCLAVFRRIIPGGQILHSSDNLGVAMNILRGERLVFETLDQDVGYFFEDDLELGPLYFHMLDRIRTNVAQLKDVGHFAAYGRPGSEHAGPAVRFIGLGHLWGFGLRRDAWRRMTRAMKGFYDAVGHVDYSGRSRYRILHMMKDRPVAANATSQDMAKTLTCAELGIARINTDVCFARYIGERGIHFNPTNFASKGFDRMTFVDSGDFELERLGPARARRIAARQFDGYARFRQQDYDRLMAEYDRQYSDPDAPLSRDQIEQAWRVLMDRVPLNEDYYRRTVGKITMRKLRAKLLSHRSVYERTNTLTPGG